LQLDGGAGEFYKVAVENPSSLPLEVTVAGKGEAGWMVIPDHRHDGVAPGARLELEFACVRRAAPLAGFRPPAFEMTFDVLTAGGRIAMPARTLPAKIALRKPAGGWPPAEKAGQFVFDGRTACLRVEPEPLRVPEGPFTVEAWVKPVGGGDGSIVSNRRGNAGFGLEVRDEPVFIVRSGGEWCSAEGAERLRPGVWTHLAGVYDGEAVSLFVNGARVASVPAGGAPEHGASPLYIAAMPSGSWVLYDDSRPAAFWAGRIDEVRVSAGARYERDFTPAIHLPADVATVFQLTSDQRFGPFAPADGSSGLHALILGDVEVVHEER
jgi:hypothetical protein